MNRCSLLPLAAALLVGTAAQGQQSAPVTATATAQPTQVTVGDPIEYAIEVKAQAGYEPLMPGLDPGLAPFEVRDYEAGAPQAVGEATVYRVQYELAVYDVGEQTIPAVAVPYRGPDGAQGTVRTEPVRIQVESVAPAGATEIKDVRPPRELSGTTLRPVLIGLALLAGLLALAAGVAYLRRRPREGVAPEPAPPARPPEEVAYEKLAELARSDLLIRGAISEYYDRLSDIVREYIEGRYEVPALEMTSEETLAGMRAAGVRDEHVALFDRVFPSWDLAKFAKHEPPDEVCRGAIDEARALVEATTPVPVHLAEESDEERPRVGRVKPHDRRRPFGSAQGRRSRSRRATTAREEARR